MFNDVRRARRAVRAFGPVQAIRTYLSHLKARWKGGSGTISVQLRSLAAPLHLRVRGSDWWVMDQVFLDCEYDPKSPPHMTALRDYVARLRENSKQPIIVDCGANVGFSAIWFAVQYPQALTIAIEPEPENFELLKRNVAAYQNIVPIQAGVSDRNETLTLHNPNTHGEQWAWATRSSPSGTVPTVTIPEILATYNDAELLIVKIDIEGAEIELLRTNFEWVAQTPLVIIETHDWLNTWGGTGHAVFSVLCRSPRDYIQRVENTFAFSHRLLAPRVAASGKNPGSRAGG